MSKYLQEFCSPVKNNRRENFMKIGKQTDENDHFSSFSRYFKQFESRKIVRYSQTALLTAAFTKALFNSHTNFVFLNSRKRRFPQRPRTLSGFTSQVLATDPEMKPKSPLNLVVKITVFHYEFLSVSFLFSLHTSGYTSKDHLNFNPTATKF